MVIDAFLIRRDAEACSPYRIEVGGLGELPLTELFG
jgi:hypothetical protein